MRKSRFSEAQIIGIIKVREAGMATTEVCRRHASADTMRQFESRIKGQGVPNLHLQEIKEVIIDYLECHDEQEVLLERLSRISDAVRLVETDYQKKISGLYDLRHSLLQKAFSGQLTA